MYYGGSLNCPGLLVLLRNCDPPPHPPANFVDFVVITPATVTFREGSVNGDTECLNIPVINENDFEGDHSFQAQLMAIEPTSVPLMLGSTLATVTIQDSDGET